MEEEHLANSCISSLKPKLPSSEPYVETTEGFDFAAALESVYPLMQMVFSYLTFKELNLIAPKVKPSWKAFAEDEILKRQSPTWVSYYKVNKKTSLHCSDKFNYESVAFAIILYDSRHIKWNKYICVHNDTKNLSRKTLMEYLSDEIVPESVSYCLLSCPKVNSYFKTGIKGPQDVGIGSYFDGLFLPAIPKVRISMFHCNPKRLDSVSSVDKYIKSSEELKCLLLFSINDLHSSIYNVFEAVYPTYIPNTLAVGGGIIRGTKRFEPLNKEKKIYTANDTLCIGFLQEKDDPAEMDAFSYVINGNGLTSEEFETELNSFKSGITMRSHSVGFRICCAAKYHTDHELILFNKVFENIPLLSMDADGEMGWNCIDRNKPEVKGIDRDETKRTKHKYPIVHHQWSTVLVILTWGPVKK